MFRPMQRAEVVFRLLRAVDLLALAEGREESRLLQSAVYPLPDEKNGYSSGFASKIFKPIFCLKR